MALEAVVFPQDPFTYGCRDLYSLLGGGWSLQDYGLEAEQESAFAAIANNKREQTFHANWDYASSSPSVMQNGKDTWDCSNSSPEAGTVEQSLAASSSGRRKRRRTKSAKNKEEIENQRMTHIAVERNRRKQMNEYLAVLRSLMPPSYVQRGDQASIIGGAINFVKELEQFLLSMEGQKRTKQDGFITSPFAEFFTFPQYTTRATQSNASCTATNDTVRGQNQKDNESAVADIEVSLVDSHANLKILSKKRPGQLVKMVLGLQSLGLCILHLNVTATLHDMVLYSVSVKVEEGSQLNTVEDIAAAVNQLLRRIQEGAIL